MAGSNGKGVGKGGTATVDGIGATVRPRPVDLEAPLAIHFESRDESDALYSPPPSPRTPGSPLLIRAAAAIQAAVAAAAAAVSTVGSPPLPPTSPPATMPHGGDEYVVPTPESHATRVHSRRPSWRMPKTYIVEKTATGREHETRVEYDLEEADEALLAEVGERLSESMVERLMDRFDKEGHYQETHGGIPYNEAELDVRCSICGVGDFDEANNRIVLCDACDVAVHQRCYDVPVLPDGNWYCRRCSAITLATVYPAKAGTPPPPSPSSVTLPRVPPLFLRDGSPNSDFSAAAVDSLARRLRVNDLSSHHEEECLYCPVFGGALHPLRKLPEEEPSCFSSSEKKRPSSSPSLEWAHCICLRWLGHGDLIRAATDASVPAVPLLRAHRCAICLQRMGATVSCHSANCDVHFHATCGRALRARGFWVELDSAGREEVFCPRHSRDAYARRVLRDESWRALLARWEADGMWTRWPLQAARPADEPLQCVFRHWYRRRCLTGAPLLRRLQLQPSNRTPGESFAASLAWEDQDEALLLRETRELAVLRKLRCQFEWARLLLDLLAKRERLRLAAVSVERVLAASSSSRNLPSPKRVRRKPATFDSED